MRASLTAIAILAAVTLAYALSCAVRPYRDCMVCDGRGHHRSKSNRKLSRPCRWCDRTGKRLRFGRRAWNRVRRVHRDAAGGARIAR